MNEGKSISDGTRERIFGLYAGQKIMTSDSFLTKKGRYHLKTPVLQIANITSVFLLVKPLWEICFADTYESIFRLFPEKRRLRRKIRKSFISTDHLNNLELSFLFPHGITINVKVNFNTGMLKCTETDAGININISPNTLAFFDFLRSRGYALPAFGFSVQELYDLNVFWWPDEGKEATARIEESKVAIPDFI